MANKSNIKHQKTQKLHYQNKKQQQQKIYTIRVPDQLGRESGLSAGSQ